MRKIAAVVFIIILILVLIIFIGPLFVGMEIQKQYPKILQTISQQRHVKVTIDKMQRDWFHTDATITFAPESMPNVKLVIHQRIHHGPFIIGKSASGKKSIMYARALVSSNSDSKNWNFHSSVLWTFENDLKSQSNLQNALFSDSLGNHFKLSDVTANATYNLNQHSLDGQYKVAQLNIHATPEDKTGQPIDVVLQNISGSMRTTFDHALWYGSHQSQIENLKGMSNNKDLFSANNLAIHYYAQKMKENSNFDFNLSAQQINLPHNKVGPVQMSLSFYDINTQSLVNFINVSSSMSPEQQSNMMLLSALYKPTLDLVSKGFSIRMNKFIVNTANGAFNLNFQAKLPAQPENQGIGELLKSFTFQGRASMPKHMLLDQLTQFYKQKQLHHPELNITPKDVADHVVQQWIANKMLVESGANVSMNMSFKAGNFLINGNQPDFSTRADVNMPASSDSDAPTPAPTTPKPDAADTRTDQSTNAATPAQEATQTQPASEPAKSRPGKLYLIHPTPKSPPSMLNAPGKAAPAKDSDNDQSTAQKPNVTIHIQPKVQHG